MVQDRPLLTEPPIHFLNEVPHGDFEPAAFIAGSHQRHYDTATKLVNNYIETKPDVASEWQKWIDNIIPKSDVAEDYVLDHPLHIPFKDILFGDVEAGAREYIGNNFSSSSNAMRTVESTTSMRHKGNRSMTPARVLLTEADGTVSTRRSVLPSIYPGKKRGSIVNTIDSLQQPPSKQDSDSDSDRDSEDMQINPSRIKPSWTYEVVSDSQNISNFYNNNIINNTRTRKRKTYDGYNI